MAAQKSQPTSCKVASLEPSVLGPLLFNGDLRRGRQALVALAFDCIHCSLN